MARTKLNTRAATIAGRSSGRMTLRTVVRAWRRGSEDDFVQALVELAHGDAMPARTPTGMLRKMKQTEPGSRPVPVISIGGTLKARM